MQTEETITRVLLPGAERAKDTKSLTRRVLEVMKSPLWICFLLALLVRIWLVVHTHGFADMDESLVGVQAQHILKGERPIYYYGQPYMGSLEAYLLAGLFALFGSSTWVLRMEPILLSLLLVWLTWHFAGMLASGAGLSASARRCFTTVAGLVAAMPPLYDLVMELRTWGGHIEIYILMLLLLLCTFRLIQRWELASWHEIALRWLVIGFIIGVGLWIYPLIASAVLASVIWIVLIFISKIVQSARAARKASELLWKAILAQSGKLLLCVLALPTCALGFAPGLFWGAANRWENVLYLFAPGSDGGNTVEFLRRYPNRMAVLQGTSGLYANCLVPHIYGGTLPAQPLTNSSPITFTALTVLISGAMIVAAGIVIASYIRRRPLLLAGQRLVALPLLFAVSTIFVFCFSSAVGGSLFEPCIRDGVGRYAAPVLVVLPFFSAALITVVYMALQNMSKEQQVSVDQVETKRGAVDARAWRFTKVGRNLPSILLILYLGLIGNSYISSNGAYVFQSFTCLRAPFDNTPIIDYMQHENIHYSWGPNVLGTSIMFKTDGAIHVADPHIFSEGALNRLPENALEVRYADRASLLDMVAHGDIYPEVLKALDDAHVTYKMARFYTEPGKVDIMVVTPLNRTLLPAEANPFSSAAYRC